MKEYESSWGKSSTEKSPVEGFGVQKENVQNISAGFFCPLQRFTFERNVSIMDKVGIICKF